MPLLTGYLALNVTKDHQMVCLATGRNTAMDVFVPMLVGRIIKAPEGCEFTAYKHPVGAFQSLKPLWNIVGADCENKDGWSVGLVSALEGVAETKDTGGVIYVQVDIVGLLSLLKSSESYSCAAVRVVREVPLVEIATDASGVHLYRAVVYDMWGRYELALEELKEQVRWAICNIGHDSLEKYPGISSSAAKELGSHCRDEADSIFVMSHRSKMSKLEAALYYFDVAILLGDTSSVWMSLSLCDSNDLPYPKWYDGKCIGCGGERSPNSKYKCLKCSNLHNHYGEDDDQDCEEEDKVIEEEEQWHEDQFFCVACNDAGSYGLRNNPYCGADVLDGPRITPHMKDVIVSTRGIRSIPKF